MDKIPGKSRENFLIRMAISICRKWCVMTYLGETTTKKKKKKRKKKADNENVRITKTEKKQKYEFKHQYQR